jgi:hypothetical protein
MQYSLLNIAIKREKSNFNKSQKIELQLINMLDMNEPKRF